MRKLIVIVGPTCSNKSDLAIKIADRFQLPIINADAFQVYKELNCGTNKLSKKIIEKYNIQLMDCISIYDEWNIKIFQDKCVKIINNFYEKNKKNIPIIVGGSNLYVDAVIKNYDLSSTTNRTDKYNDWTNEELYNYLSKIDQNEANKSINNHKRLVRAIQIIDQIKQQKSKKDTQKNYYYDCFVIFINPDRQTLYKKINENVLRMLANGWKDEIFTLINKDNNVVKLNAFKAIGYLDIYDSIKNNNDINVELISQNTRRYAKRQITWCKNKYQNPFILRDNYEQLFTELYKFINK